MKRLLLVIFATASLFAQGSEAPSSQITIEGKVESVLYARRVEAGPWEYRQYAGTVAVQQVLSKTTLKPSVILIEFQEKKWKGPGSPSVEIPEPILYNAGEVFRATLEQKSRGDFWTTIKKQSVSGKNEGWLPKREGQTSCSDCYIPSNK